MQKNIIAILCACTLLFTVVVNNVAEGEGYTYSAFSDEINEAFNNWTMLENNSIVASEKIVCIGDSITYGSDASQDTNGTGAYMGYPWRLNETLLSRYPNAGFTVINSGVPGDKAADVIARLSTINGYAGTILIVNIGVNDLGNIGNLTQFQANYTALMTALEENHTSSDIYTSSMTPFKWESYPSSSEAKHKQWNSWLYNYSIAHGYGWIDFYSILDRYDDLTNARVHPNDGGYQKMANYVVDILIGYGSQNVDLYNGRAYINHTTGLNDRWHYYNSYHTDGIYSGFNYSGNWTGGYTASGWMDALYYSGTENTTNKLTADIVGGGQMRIFHTKGSNKGIVTVTVDGVEKGSFDTYASGGTTFGHFANFDLGDYGYHVVEFEPDDKNTSSSGYQFGFEALKVNGSVSEISTIVSENYFDNVSYNIDNISINADVKQELLWTIAPMDLMTFGGNITYYRTNYWALDDRQFVHYGENNNQSPYIEYSYVGTDFDITWTESTPCGWANITVDGVFDGSIDTDRVSGSFFGAHYSKSGMSYGRHTVRIIPQGNVTGNYVFIEAFLYKTYNYNVEIYNSAAGNWTPVFNGSVIDFSYITNYSNQIRYRITCFEPMNFKWFKFTVNGEMREWIPDPGPPFHTAPNLPILDEDTFQIIVTLLVMAVVLGIGATMIYTIKKKN